MKTFVHKMMDVEGTEFELSNYGKLTNPKRTTMLLTKVTWCYKDYLTLKECCFWFEYLQ